MRQEYIAVSHVRQHVMQSANVKRDPNSCTNLLHHHDVYGKVHACGIYGQLHDGLEVEYIAIYMHVCL